MKPAVLAAALAAWALAAEAACGLRVVGMRTNNMVDPFVSQRRGGPFLSWKLEYNGTDAMPQFQSMYRIVACDDVVCRNPLWDTGRVSTSETLAIPYRGTVRSGLKVYWQVSVWDHDQQYCNWSAPASFEFALLSEPDWSNAEWIARRAPAPVTNQCALYDPDPTPLFRAEAALQNTTAKEGPVISARLYIAGLGYFRSWLNGAPVRADRPFSDAGDPLPHWSVDPPWTDFAKRVYYRAFNVTERVAAAANASVVLGIEAGNGYWNPLPLQFWGHLNLRSSLPVGVPMVRALLLVTFYSGHVQKWTTGAGSLGGWAVGSSPTVSNNVYLGERYDARLEADTEGWLSPGFDASEWPVPVGVQTPGVGILDVSPTPPVGLTGGKVLDAVVVNRREEADGVQVLTMDTGRNHAGTCSFSFAGAAGTPVAMRYGELLFGNGTVDVLTSTAGQIKAANPNAPCQPTLAYQQDHYTLRGSDNTDREIWTPAFSWHGFRYVEVTTAAVVSSVRCYPLATEVPRFMTHFTTSDTTLQKLYNVAVNTFDSNLMSVQSDCPHRERFGYGGDPLAVGESLMLTFDLSAFYDKVATDFEDAQRSNGGFTETAPFVGIADAGLGGGAGPIGWATWPPELQLLLYRYYGNSAAIADMFNGTLTYMALVEASPEQVQNGLGDWMPVEPTGTDFTGLGFEMMGYRAMANLSAVVGRPDLQANFTAKAEAVAQKINTDFLDPATGAYGNVNNSRSRSRGLRSRDASPLYSENLGAAFNGTQTAQGFALFSRIAPAAARGKVLTVLLDNLNAAQNIPMRQEKPCYDTGFVTVPTAGTGPHLLTGMFGVKWVLQALSEAGHSDLAYEVVTQETYPSFNYMTVNPEVEATTLWESWFFSNNTYSHNHPMFGSHQLWMVQSLVGFAPHPAAKGLDYILIQPRPSLRMAQSDPLQKCSVAASFDTARGTVDVSWTLTAASKTFSLRLTIPPNMRAVVTLPDASPTFTVGSGTFSYTAQLP